MAYYESPNNAYVSQALVDAGILKTKTPNYEYQLDISFRHWNQMCVPMEDLNIFYGSTPFDMKNVGAIYRNNIGYHLIVNQDTLNEYLPVTTAQATTQKWMRGACVARMGEHWWKDITKDDATMSWSAWNVFPLVLMYDIKGDVSPMGEGGLVTFFFNSPGGQQAGGSTGGDC